MLILSKYVLYPNYIPVVVGISYINPHECPINSHSFPLNVD